MGDGDANAFVHYLEGDGVRLYGREGEDPWGKLFPELTICCSFCEMVFDLF